MSDKNAEIRVKFEIGEIKFEAEGSADLVERERSIFTNTLLPSAVEAIVRTRGVAPPAQYVDAAEQRAMLLPDESDKAMEDIMPTMTPIADLSRTSLVSFVNTKGADAHYDFILCAVSFNEKKNGISSFSSTTLKELYAEAKKPLPNNLSMSISELVKKGLIMENPSVKGANPKEYVLTIDGEAVVNKMLPKEGKEKKAATKPRKLRPKEKSVYSDINIDELNLDKYPEVKAMKSIKDKMMMTLYIIVSEGKGEWFSVNDVVFLLKNKFGESITERQAKGVFERNVSWFDSSKKDGSKEIERKLLNGGKDYAKALIPIVE
ncbi:MAG: hypothetical protein VB082_01115 [Christensenella sp.]|nr:hypothetical protein [Christensenella sp.]